MKVQTVGKLTLNKMVFKKGKLDEKLQSFRISIKRPITIQTPSIAKKVINDRT